MTETATVLTNNGNTVLLGCGIESDTCKSCAGNAFCNIKERTYEAILDKGVSVEEGDVVQVFLPPGRTILAGFMILILPLLFFLLFFLLARNVFLVPGEGKQALFGILGLGLGFVSGFGFGRINRKKNMPRVIGKANS